MDALIGTLRQHPRITRHDIARLFYGKYPFRVDFDFHTYDAAHKGRFRIPIEGLDGLTFIDSAGIIEEIAPTCSFKTRTQNNETCFYFVDQIDAAAFVQAQSEFVTSVRMPSCSNALAAMLSDIRIEVRDTLFWNKFRWAAVCKSLSHEQLDEIREWINSYKEQFSSAGDDRIFLSYSSSSPRIFFDQEDDLFMFKFAFFNRVARLEKVLLKKDIADAPFIAQGTG